MNKNNKLWLAVAMDVTMIVLILVNINLVIFDSFFSIHVISGFFQNEQQNKTANLRSDKICHFLWPFSSKKDQSIAENELRSFFELISFSANDFNDSQN